MHRVVVHKFFQGKEFGPVILLLVAEGSEVLFQSVVLPLSLAIGLWVECGRRSVVDVHVGAESNPTSASERRSAVCDDIRR